MHKCKPNPFIGLLVSQSRLNSFGLSMVTGSNEEFCDTWNKQNDEENVKENKVLRQRTPAAVWEDTLFISWRCIWHARIRRRVRVEQKWPRWTLLWTLNLLNGGFSLGKHAAVCLSGRLRVTEGRRDGERERGESKDGLGQTDQRWPSFPFGPWLN